MLIGTTDTDYTGDLDAVEAEANDVTYLLKEGQRIFPNVRSGDIFYTSAGLRALARSKSRKPGDVSRSHKLSAKAPCTTAEVPLPGAPIVPQQSLQQAANERGLALDTVAHLASLYGSRFSQVLDILNSNPKGAQPLCPHSQDILAQVQHAVEQEGALTIEDFLLRRSAVGLSSCRGLDTLNSVASEMGRLLGWSYTEQQRQEDAYRSQAALGQRFRSAGLA